MGVPAVRVARQGTELGKEVGGHLPGNLQAEQVLELGQPDEHCNAIGEPDHDGHGHVPHQGPEAQQTHQKQQPARHEGGQQQTLQAVPLQDAVDHHDEGPGGSTDLHVGAAEQRDEQPGHDGGNQAAFRR